MIVFKTYFRLMKKNIGSITLPLVIFLIISLGLNATTRSQSAEFERRKANVVYINHAEETTITRGLRTYLQETMNLIELDETLTEDAIFYRQADFIVIQQTDNSFDYEMIYDASYGYLAKESINQFLNNVDLYQNFEPTLSDQEIVDKVLTNARETIDVDLINTQDTSTSSFAPNYFNMLPYIIMLLLFGVIGKNLLSFNRSIIIGRSNVSSLSQKRQSTQLFISTILVLHILLLMIGTFTYFLVKDKLGASNSIFYFVNMYVFSWAALAICFLVSRVVKTDTGLSAVTTGLSLGLSFISGCFVPQQYISGGIIAFSKLTPVYWSVHINELLGGGAVLSDLWIPFAIQIGFTVAIVLITLIITKQRNNISMK